LKTHEKVRYLILIAKARSDCLVRKASQGARRIYAAS
jgi:hypothetical protein